MASITIAEAIVKFLWANKGNWIPSYDLEKAVLGGKFTGISGNRTARDLGQTGYYESDNFKYYIERKKIGKYAHYRVTQRVVIEKLATVKEAIAWFNSLPIK